MNAEESITRVEDDLTAAEKVLAGQLRAQADKLDKQVPRLRSALERTVAAAKDCRAAADRLDPQACGAKASDEPGADECTMSWVPCMKPAGHLEHDDVHWSTSGCAGGEVTWKSQPVETEVVDLVAALRASVEAAKERRLTRHTCTTSEGSPTCAACKAARRA